MAGGESRSTAQKLGGYLFAAVVGIVAAWLSYSWITNPVPRAERQQEERIVEAAVAALRAELGPGDWEVVDPLNPNRIAGRTYVYPVDGGWEVSGHYRSGDEGPWFAWLMLLDASGDVLRLTTQSQER